jgi:phosphoenolpyruvate carboxykinase (ATP)
MGKKVKPADTLGIIEAIVEGKTNFKQWGPFEDIEIFEWEGFVPNLNDPEYKAQLTARMKDRIEFVASRDTEKGGFDKLPAEALEALKKVVSELEK